MGEEEEEFLLVIMQCLNVLILGVETRLDVGLQKMMRMKWEQFEMASSLPCRSPSPVQSSHTLYISHCVHNRVLSVLSGILFFVEGNV